MSLKVKLLSCIGALVLVVCCFLVGVYAAQSAQVSMGGTVSFTADTVYATIRGTISGTNTTPQTLPDIEIDYNSPTEIAMPTQWQNMILDFTDAGTNIVVTIYIDNKATDRGINVTLTDNSTGFNNVTLTKTYNSTTNITGTTDTQQIAHASNSTTPTTGTYAFTLVLDSRNNEASGTFSISMNLANNPNL